VLIVGGNIEGFTRVMTTAIALETSRGNLPMAMGLGLVLIAIVIGVNALAWGVRRFGELRRLLPGVSVDGRRVWTSYEALQVEATPESLIIIGAGAVGEDPPGQGMGLQSL
jgi:hypothetical protein